MGWVKVMSRRVYSKAITGHLLYTPINGENFRASGQRKPGGHSCICNGNGVLECSREAIKMRILIKVCQDNGVLYDCN